MRFKLLGRVVFFATGNISKFNESRRVLAEYGIAVGMLKVKPLEIQSENLEEIAKTSVIEVLKKVKLPIIVEDAGLFVEALNGFPGPYSAYVYKTIGNKGLLKLLNKVANRKARFRSSIAYFASDLTTPMCFDGEVVGEITSEALKSVRINGFGFDPVFKPFGSNRTFAEMTIDEKAKFSHRAKALKRFADWYKKQGLK